MKARKRRAQARGDRKIRIRLKSREGRDVDDGARAGLLHDRGHKARHAHDVEQDDIEPEVPVGIGNGKEVALRRVARVVHHRVDPAVTLHRQVTNRSRSAGSVTEPCIATPPSSSASVTIRSERAIARARIRVREVRARWLRPYPGWRR